MTILSSALAYAKERDIAQQGIETTLKDRLQEYIDFLPQRGSSWVPHYKHATYYSFLELDGKNFIFRGDEFYDYGDEEWESISLPFEFVEAPETYKERILAEIEALKRQREAKAKASQEEKVAKLRDQLAKAEAALAKSQTKDDLIATVALTKQTGEIRSTLNRQVD